MKKVAVVSMGVMLGQEKQGHTRLRFLSDFLASRYGYEVDLVTTSFQHWDKKHRDVTNFNKGPAAHYNPVFVEEPGYRTNLDPARVRSHAIASKNLAKYFAEHDDYCLVYAEMPPNDFAYAAMQAARKRNIPFVADINDLWPEAMRMVLDVPLLSRALFSGFSHDASEIYRKADAFVGASQEYIDRVIDERIRRDGDAGDAECLVVYTGLEINNFDEGVARFEAWTDKEEGEFWVTYAGSLGTSCDVATLILAADEIVRRGQDDIHVKILGAGPAEAELKELAASLEGHVDFVGYLPYQKMAAYLRKSDVTVNSFVRKSPQSIVNKIGDYLASGHPIVNTSSSPELRNLIEDEGVGVNIEAGDVAVLVAAIEELYENASARKDMGLKARVLAEERFDRPRSYRPIAELIGRLLER